MEKKLSIASLCIAALLLILFVLDIALGLPFGGGSTFLVIDIVGIVAGSILLYLSWNALRDLL